MEKEQKNEEKVGRTKTTKEVRKSQRKVKKEIQHKERDNIRYNKKKAGKLTS